MIERAFVVPSLSSLLEGIMTHTEKNIKLPGSMHLKEAELHQHAVRVEYGVFAPFSILALCG